jgi:hypothetical protein
MDTRRSGTHYQSVTPAAVRQLAGRLARVQVRPWSVGAKATVRWLFGGASAIGRDSDEALRGLAYALAEHRLAATLSHQKWQVLEDLTWCEEAYVVARSPDGTLWRVGVAESSDETRRRRLLRTSPDDVETGARVAVVEPLATLNGASLVAAIDRSVLT